MVDVPVWSETASSNTTASPDGWPEGMAPSGVNNSARENMAALRRFWSRINGVKTGGGSANAVTCNFDVAEAAYYTGARTVVKLGTTNTGPASLNLSALGAVTIKDIYGNDLVGGELNSGAYAEFLYNGTNQILLQTVQYLGPTFVWKKALSGASVDFDPLPTGFARFDLNIYDYIPVTNGSALALLAKASGSFQSTDYLSASLLTDGTVTEYVNNTSNITIFPEIGNTTAHAGGALLTIYDPDNTANPKAIHLLGSNHRASSGSYKSMVGGGRFNGNPAITGLRLIPSTGNITSGTAVLVGWRF